MVATSEEASQTIGHGPRILAMSPDKFSPFSKLSAELRNQIYENVLCERQPIDITSERQPGLTRTAKAMRAECLKLYYATNIFAFSPATSDGALKQLEAWLLRIGIKDCKSLRKVIITLSKDTGLLVDHFEEDRDPCVSLVAVMKATGCMPHLQLELRLHENMRPPPAVLESMSGLLTDIENDVVRDLVEIRRAMAHTRLTSYLQMLQWRQCNPVAFKPWESVHYPEFVTMVRQSTNERDCTYNWNKREDTLRPRQDFESDQVDEGLAAFSERFSKLEEFETGDRIPAWTFAYELVTRVLG